MSRLRSENTLYHQLLCVYVSVLSQNSCLHVYLHVYVLFSENSNLKNRKLIFNDWLVLNTIHFHHAVSIDSTCQQSIDSTLASFQIDFNSTAAVLGKKEEEERTRTKRKKRE